MAHDTSEVGHPGQAETLREVKRRYYHRNLSRRVSNYVRRCLICSSVKSNIYQGKAPLKPRTPKAPFETISIDVLGPYPKTPNGKRFIIAVEDIFTKWVEAVPVEESTADVICNMLEETIFQRYGPPHTIISDNGVQFKSNRYIRLSRSYNYTLYYTPVSHQRSNCVERKIQDLKKVLRTLMIKRVRKNTWDKFLPAALKIMRSRRNAATGMSPAKALLGYELPKRGDWQTSVYLKERAAEQATHQERKRLIKRNQREYNNKTYEPNPRPPRVYNVGDQVLVRELRERQTEEFSPKWVGPLTITRKRSNEVYDVMRGDVEVTLHVDHLRKAPAGNPEVPEYDDGSSESSGNSSPEDLSTPEEESESEEDEIARTRSLGTAQNTSSDVSSQARDCSGISKNSTSSSNDTSRLQDARLPSPVGTSRATSPPSTRKPYRAPGVPDDTSPFATSAASSIRGVLPTMRQDTGVSPPIDLQNTLPITSTEYAPGEYLPENITNESRQPRDSAKPSCRDAKVTEPNLWRNKPQEFFPIPSTSESSFQSARDRREHLIQRGFPTIDVRGHQESSSSQTQPPPDSSQQAKKQSTPCLWRRGRREPPVVNDAKSAATRVSAKEERRPP